MQTSIVQFSHYGNTLMIVKCGSHWNGFISFTDPALKKYAQEVNGHSKIKSVFLPLQPPHQLLAVPIGYHLRKAHKK